MNIFKIVINRIVMISLLMFSLNVYAFEILEHVIEAQSLRITLDKKGTGSIQGRICDDCKLLTVAVSPETKAFQNGVEVPVVQAKSRLGKSATVFIDIEHTSVLRITWWQDN